MTLKHSKQPLKMNLTLNAKITEEKKTQWSCPQTKATTLIYVEIEIFRQGKQKQV